MKNALLLTAFLCFSGNIFSQDLLQYVKPEIGTAHSRWFFFTPAAVPYGMAKLAPSTNGHYGNPSGWEAVGYDVRHHSIEGFVHFHEWQVGGVSVMPVNGPLKVKPGELNNPSSGYRSRFDRRNEVAVPGYYKVALDDYGITAELTATTHVGFHRYTFPANNHSAIILDVGNEQGESGEVIDAFVKMIDQTHFEGSVTTYPKYVRNYDPKGRISMYFWGETSRKPNNVKSFTANKNPVQKDSASGKGAGIVLEYQTIANDIIELKVGLSYTSIENARLNLEAEAKKLSFDEAKKFAQQSWQQELSRIRVEGNNDQNKIKFYTGLFHALLGRGIASDVNGSFPRHNGSIGRLATDHNGKAIHNFMNTDAIWGAFWNLTQLWALVYPSHYSDYVNTQLEIYKERGWFGDGIANSNYVSGVGTNFVGLAIAGAFQSGIRDYDVDLAFKAIKENELGWKDRNPGSGKMDTKLFVERKWVPYIEEDKTDSTGSHFSASHTLEYSFSSFAAAQMAKALGKQEDYQRLIQYADGWKFLFDDSLKLIRPKTTDGKFIERFDPAQPWRGFQEGNAIQYTFYVPHHPKALITRIGKDEFNKRLNKIFETAQKNNFGGGKEINAFAGIKSLYNHGNQPNLHISWLFNFSGRPWLTQKWTRAICNEFYGTESIHGYGYGQDEDQGQLGSWYVMAALGLFDVKGLVNQRPVIQIGSPLFDLATIQLGNGKQLDIQTKNNSGKNIYIQSAKFNGKPLENCWLYLDELMKGGRLDFMMGPTPNVGWGVKLPPPSD